MIYILAGAALLALLVWAGRGGLRGMDPGGVRISAGVVSILALVAAGLFTLRGIWPLGLLLLGGLLDPKLIGPIGPLGATEVVTAKFTACSGGGDPACVIDGDTIRLGDRTIRITGIDAPDIAKPLCPAEAELGRRSAARLLELQRVERLERLRRHGTVPHQDLAEGSLRGHSFTLRAIGLMMIGGSASPRRPPRGRFCRGVLRGGALAGAVAGAWAGAAFGESSEPPPSRTEVGSSMGELGRR